MHSYCVQSVNNLRRTGVSCVGILGVHVNTFIERFYVVLKTAFFSPILVAPCAQIIHTAIPHPPQVFYAFSAVSTEPIITSTIFI
jgi:hypothetical protein